MLVAGHDNGLVVFKLERERAPYDSQKQLFYYKDRYVRAHNFKTKQDLSLFSVMVSKNNPFEPRLLSYNAMNPSEYNFLLTNVRYFYSLNVIWMFFFIKDTDGGSYELYTVGKNAQGGEQAPSKGIGMSAVFVSRTRFAVLDQTKQVSCYRNL